MSKRWTEEELKIATNMAKKGNSYKEISFELNRSYGSIRKKLVGLGITVKKNYHMEPYKYDIGEIVGDGTLKIVSRSRKNKKRYIVKSLTYPNSDNDYEISEYHLIRGQRDAYLSGKRVCEENSLWSKKEYRKYIVDVKQAKSIPPHYTKLISLKCPSCGNKKKGKPTNLMQGFSCSFCTRGYYPELWFSSFNESLELGFKSQQRFRDFEGFIFDFVNYETRIIVETHGSQHYDDNNKFFDYERTMKSDEDKRKYCKNNNWTLIEIDCSKSDFYYILNNVNNCELLPSVKDKKTINRMMDLIKLNSKYPIQAIKDMYAKGLSCNEIGSIIGASSVTVGNILRRNGVSLRNGSVELPEYNICEMYKNGLTSTEISSYYGCSYHTILKILRKNNISIRNTSKNRRVVVKCITTNKIFNSVLEASKYYSIYRSNIQKALKDKRKSAGKHPITGEKLRWEYVD